jgi:hypothetical protein
MSSILIPPRIQFIDENGEPLVNGKVYTYEAGTSTPKTSWKDQGETVANTNPVILDDAGRAQIWIRGAYKIVVHDSTDVLIYEDDDVISYTDVDFTGLTATIDDLNSTNTSGITITNNYSIQESDRGKTILVNAASTPITVNLLAAATATNRYRITIKKIDFSSNDVTVDPNLSELVDGRSTYLLHDYGDFIEILCDGSTWHLVAAQIRGTIITETASFSVTLDDDGKLFNCDTTAANVVVTLPAISTLGKGFEISFKKIDSALNSVIINPDGAETIDGASSLEIERQYQVFTLKSDSLDWYVSSDLGAGISGVIPNKYIAGLETSQVAPDPDHDIQIEVGVFTDSTNTSLFELRSPIIKEINNTWAEGNLAGGMASGVSLTANTWYHVFALAKLNGDVDVGFDTSISATNLLADSAVQAAGYLFYRRIWSLVTDGSSNIFDYFQIYETCYFEDPVNTSAVLAGTSVPFNSVFTLTVPPDVRVEAIVNYFAELDIAINYVDDVAAILEITDKTYSVPSLVYNVAPGASVGLKVFTPSSDNRILVAQGQTHIYTDTSQQVQSTITGSVTSGTYTLKVGLNTVGYIDKRLD